MRATISIVCIFALMISGVCLIGEPTPGGYFDEHFLMFVLSKVVCFAICYGSIQLLRFVNTSDTFND